MEELTCVQFDDPSVFERGSSRAGKNKADVFDPTERGSGMPVLSAAACVLAIGLAGCEVGPDYRPDGTIVQTTEQAAEHDSTAAKLSRKMRTDNKLPKPDTLRASDR